MNKENIEKAAVVRIRGLTGVKHDIDITLNKLRLYKKNYCVVVPRNASYMGMIKRAKDYITWGDIDEDTYKELIDKRKQEFKERASDKNGKIQYTKFIEVDGSRIKKFFRLNSPRKGYGRKGIKVSFVNGGALGYRGKDINDLIKRML